MLNCVVYNIVLSKEALQLMSDEQICISGNSLFFPSNLSSLSVGDGCSNDVMEASIATPLQRVDVSDQGSDLIECLCLDGWCSNACV